MKIKTRCLFSGLFFILFYIAAREIDMYTFKYTPFKLSFYLRRKNIGLHKKTCDVLFHQTNVTSARWDLKT